MKYFFGILLFTNLAQARPEFALKYRTVNCRLCHVSPIGGGYRNAVGKQYRASSVDYMQGDLRLLFYLPENTTNTRSGAGIMSSIVSAKIDLGPKDQASQTTLVAAYDLGVFNPGPRETYLLWQNEFSNPNSSTVMVGKFNLPFGLLTDEHRTYTKIQTNTSFNDFASGVLWSVNSNNSHIDVGLTEGQQSGGTLDTGVMLGSTANLRYGGSGKVPYFVGLSTLTYRREPGTDPYAIATYAALSLSELTHDYWPGSFILEFTQSKYFNDASTTSNVVKNFIGIGLNTGYEAAVKNSEAIGWYAKLNYDINQKFTAFFKFDSLTLDRHYPADSFIRHGLGLNYAMTNETHINARVESANAKRPGIADSVMAKNDAFFLVMHTSF